MAVNKVDVNGATVLDLTQDSVTPETLKKGETTHDASGALIVGTMETVMIPKTTALLKGDGVGGVAAATTDATPTQGSTNPVQSGGVYTALSALGAARIQTGSYVGTGKAGSSNPNRITFSFTPKLVVITENGSNMNGRWVHNSSSMIIGGSNTDIASLSGNTLSWYADDTWGVDSSTILEQLNFNGRTYYWVAFG